LFGAPTSVSTRATPVTTHPLLPNDPLKEVSTPESGNRMRLSSSPFCTPDPFTAAAPETDNAPAAPWLLAGASDRTNASADGYGINVRPWTRNELSIVGPAGDPAGIRGMTNGAAALRKQRSSPTPTTPARAPWLTFSSRPKSRTSSPTSARKPPAAVPYSIP